MSNDPDRRKAKEAEATMIEENPAEPVLVVDGLSKSYRGRKVVDGVSLTVGAGEIVGLLGPNGAGKSTAFNMVAGLVPPDKGRVCLGAQELGALPFYRRAQKGLGYLPQESTIFRGLTVLDNLAAVYEAQGKNSRESKAAAERVLERYHLGPVRDNLGAQLSGGERRRVEMARALISKPRVVLFDEPFAGIDPIAVAEIQGFIKGIRDRGLGILLTDHNVRETLGICDRAYLISQGRIMLTGSPQEIAADPTARTLYLGEDFRL